MAYVKPLRKDDEEGKNTQVVTTGGSAGGGGGASPDPAKPSSSGQFTNITSYLNANRPGGESLGAAVGGTISKAGQQATSDINKAGSEFTGKVGAGTVNLNEGLLSKAINDPTSLTNTPEYDQLIKMRVGEYGGPTAWEGSAEANAANTSKLKALETAKLAESTGGRKELLRESTTNLYTSGGLSLNQALIQNTEGVLGGVLDKANQTKGVEGLYGTTGQNAAGAIKSGQDTSAATGATTKGRLTTAATDFRSFLENRAKTRQEQEAADQARLGQAFGGVSTAAGKPGSGGYKGGFNNSPFTESDYNWLNQNWRNIGGSSKSEWGGKERGAWLNDPANMGGLSQEAQDFMKQNFNSVKVANNFGDINWKAVPGSIKPVTTAGTAATIDSSSVTDDQLKQLGMDRPQFDNFLKMNAEAQQYGGGVNVADYLQQAGGQYTAGGTSSSQEVDKFNALNNLAQTQGSLQTGGAAGTSKFNIGDATALLQSQIQAGKANASQQGLAEEGLRSQQASQADAEKQRKEDKYVKTGTAIGAAVGSIIPVIGTAIGGLIGGVVGKLFCFTGDTSVYLPDGSLKRFDQLELGEEVMGGRILAIGKAYSNNLYYYKGTKVAGEHSVFENDTWLHVEDSEHAVRVPSMSQDHVVYPFVVDTHRIAIYTEDNEDKFFVASDMLEVDEDETWSLSKAERLQILNDNLKSSVDKIFEEVLNG